MLCPGSSGCVGLVLWLSVRCFMGHLHMLALSSFVMTLARSAKERATGDEGWWCLLVQWWGQRGLKGRGLGAAPTLHTAEVHAVIGCGYLV